MKFYPKLSLKNKKISNKYNNKNLCNNDCIVEIIYNIDEKSNFGL